MTSTDIREHLRTDLKEERQFKRDRVHYSKRNVGLGLEAGTSSNLQRQIRPRPTANEVKTITDNLKRKSRLTINDLTSLKLAFVNDLNNIIVFLKTKGALHSLIRELTNSSKSNFQLVATECCCNLALGDAKSCLQVAKAAGPYLMSHLNGCNRNLMSVSIWTLGNLAGCDIKTWMVIKSQRFLPTVLQMIDPSPDPTSTIACELQNNCLNALVHYLHIGLSHLTPQEFEDIVKTLLCLPNTSGNVIWSLYLVSCSEVAAPILVNCGLLEKCLAYLEVVEVNETCVKSVTAMVRTSANLVAEPSGRCGLVLLTNWKATMSIVEKLFTCEFSYLRSETAWLVANILNNSSPEGLKLLEENVHDLLLIESMCAPVGETM